MAIRNNPGTVSSNLVFAYDIADTRNSYIGQPTTNQYTNPDFTSGLTGWTFASWDGGIYSYTTENVLGPFGNVVPALKITRTGTQTFADFHQGNGGKYTSGNSYTLSAYIKGSGTLVGNTQGGFSGGGANFTLTDQWQRVSYTVFSSTNSNYPYWDAARITPNVPMYFVFAQSEQKSNVTPYVNGTRSNTQGLLDISGYNRTIDLSNMSFNSNAQMTFDGTDDYIPSIGSAIVGAGSSPYTVSVWVNRSRNNVGYEELLAQWTYANSGNSFYFGFDSGNVRFTDNWASVSVTGAGNTNVWMNLVGVNTGANAFIYLNGSLAATKGSALTYTGTGPFIIGRQGELAGEYFQGKLDKVQVYNRALSSDEVLQNYNSFKKRFNL